MIWRSKASMGLAVRGDLRPRDLGLFPEEFQGCLVRLHRHFQGWRDELLVARAIQQAKFDAGSVPRFTPEHPCHGFQWNVASIPADLQDRRVEITGPIHNTKMVINMLNPRGDGVVANTAMLDFEDSMAPTWSNVLDGIHNLIGVANRNLSCEVFEKGMLKHYKLKEVGIAHPMVRVRGLHMDEEHVTVDGQAVSAGLFDLAASAWWTARTFVEQGRTPKFYVPKTQSSLEARWWNEVFAKVEQEVGLPRGTLRVTFLIETLPAAFQMEEILWEIRERACGLNGGRWDKIFSDIKTLGRHPDRIMADRSSIDMTRPWMDNYAKLLIKICHRHGAYAMGGMSAFTPGQSEEQRAAQSEKVRQDKKREASIGHDGCWVSHPYFISIAQEQFKQPHQLHQLLAEFPSEPDLLPSGGGPRTLKGLRTNIRVGIAYVEGWNRGLGCIAFDGLMEDLATLEISRAQVWQWLHHQVILDDGVQVTKSLVTLLFQEETERLLSELAESLESLEDYKQVCARYLLAAEQCRKLFLLDPLPEFFTTYWREASHAEATFNLGSQSTMAGSAP